MKTSKTTGFLFLIIVSLFFLVPLLFQLVGLEFTGNFTNEQRELAEFPQPLSSKKEIPSWINDFEAYIDDNLAYRKFMVPLYNTLLYSLNESSTERIVFGKNSWLYNNYDNLTNQIKGELIGNKNVLSRSVDNLLRVQNRLKQYGIPFQFYVAPNKASIYPENLPSHIVPSAITTYDLFLEIAQNRNLNITDIHTCLKEAKANHSENQLYYTTDTHWNFSGAFYAYQCLSENFDSKFRKYNLTYKTSEIKNEDYHRYFGLLERLGTFPIVFDKGTNITPDTKVRIKFAQENPNKKHITTGRKLSIYTNLAAKNELTALLIGDSFNGFISPYFTNKFKKVVIIPSNNGRWDTSVLSTYNPDLIIYEVLERFLIGSISQPNW